MDDPLCLNCNFPLRAFTSITDGRCTDIEACDARRYKLAELGQAHLITPEGVTLVEPPKED